MREQIRTIVEGTDTVPGRIFDLSVQLFILISTIGFALETVPSLASGGTLFRVIEISTVVAFTIEYFLRVYSSKEPLRYMSSALGVLDLLAFLPFYIRAGDLRFLRVARLLRVFRILKLARYSQGIHLMQRAVLRVEHALVGFFLILVLSIFLAGTGVYYAEHHAQPGVFASIPSSMWWAIVTMTTVGYGDAYPATVGGRLFASVVMLLGTSIVAVPTGLLSAAFVEALHEESAERKEHGSE